MLWITLCVGLFCGWCLGWSHHRTWLMIQDIRRKLRELDQ